MGNFYWSINKDRSAVGVFGTLSEASAYSLGTFIPIEIESYLIPVSPPLITTASMEFDKNTKKDMCDKLKILVTTVNTNYKEFDTIRHSGVMSLANGLLEDGIEAAYKLVNGLIELKRNEVNSQLLRMMIQTDFSLERIHNMLSDVNKMWYYAKLKLNTVAMMREFFGDTMAELFSNEKPNVGLHD